ncbi:glycerol-3-phosphate acyltransferase [Jeotgalibacillus sp. ET6]|uniref:glycerol-3-phosphate acyltransferase n=1 Tax=Jeotgalibacillus sp. ET6 TaxID=3037260 RepID=UPI002418840C|nr:glycerol-3-phosphate acyltransferase [Jeotgalibacillus sp. ET6]MDG5472687.1 glycerol-3-phosphate acyltransferase [Jeotgalibacillus sp. ET6]
MQTETVQFIVVALYSYLIGGFTGAYYLVKLFLGKDIRQMESGNAGATNAGRVIGKKGFLLTIAIDAAKVWITLGITSYWAEGSGPALVLSSILLVIGHLYPLQLGFRGGKGIVVYLAAALFLNPYSILVMGAVMGVLYSILRRYTLSGFLSILTIPVTLYILEDSLLYFVSFIVLFAFLAAIHHK